MNKIKKALQLQEALENDAVVAKPARAQPAGNSSANSYSPDRHPLTGSNGPLARASEYDLANERLPTTSIAVDLDRLQEFGLHPKDDDLDLVRQQFRRIKRPVLNIAFGTGVEDGENTNIIMMASAMPHSGKSFCSINLAASIAHERDIGTVLVDADVLKPYISEALGLGDHVGLIDYLLDSTVQLDDILVATDYFGIVVVPAGRHHDEATELLASRRMKRFFAELSERFQSRAVIVDTPPLLLTNEADVLADHMGQIALVIEAGVSTHESVTRAVNSLNQSKPINVILNKTQGVSFGDYDGSGYGYYPVTRPGRKDARAD